MPLAFGDHGEKPAAEVRRTSAESGDILRHHAFASDEECQRFLAGKSIAALLDAFADSDPLRLVRRCSSHLWNEALFLEPDRLVHHAAAAIAYQAARRPESDSVDVWIQKCIRRATRELLYRDESQLREVREPIEPWTAVHGFVQAALGLEASEALFACTLFNQLPRRNRRAFFALVMERRAVEDCLKSGFGPLPWLRETCTAALDRLLGLAGGSHPESNGRQEDLENHGR